MGLLRCKDCVSYYLNNVRHIVLQNWLSTVGYWSEHFNQASKCFFRNKNRKSTVNTAPKKNICSNDIQTQDICTVNGILSREYILITQTNRPVNVLQAFRVDIGSFDIGSDLRILKPISIQNLKNIGLISLIFANFNGLKVQAV